MKATLLPGIPEEGEPLLRLKGEGVPGRSGILGNNDWRMERDSGPMGGFHNVFRLAAFCRSLSPLDATSRIFTFFRVGAGRVSFARPVLLFSILLPGLLHPPGAPPLFATPCRGHGLADRLGTGARRVQRRVWGLRRATCQRTGERRTPLKRSLFGARQESQKRNFTSTLFSHKRYINNV